MHRKLFAFVFVAALLFSAVGVIADSDSSDAVTPTTITGYLGKIGTSDVDPVVGLKVYIYKASDEGQVSKYCESTATDSNGQYTVDISELDDLSNLRISLENADYIIFIGAAASGMTKISTTVWSLPDLTSTLSTTYELGTSVQNGCIINNAYVDFTIFVEGNDKQLRNARINLYDTDSGTQIESGETDSDGKCKFIKLPYGKYNLKVTCNGFKQYYEENLLVNGQAIHSVTMIEKEVPTFYGMTTYHALMLVGVAAGLILFTISYIMVRRNSKGIKD